MPVEVVAGVRSAFAAVQVVHGDEALSSSALAVHMGVSPLAEIAGAALAAGVDPGTPAAIVENGTTATQRATRAPHARVATVAAEVGVRSPAVIVPDAVAADGLLDAPADTRLTHDRVTLAP